MINFYEGIKKLFNKNNKGANFKLEKNKKKNYFVKSDTLDRMSSKEVSDFTERLISWYRVKVPYNILSQNKEKVSIDSTDVNFANFKNMTFDELFKRNRDLEFLKCRYKNNDPFDKGSVSLKIYTTKGLFNNKEDQVCKILADKDSGKILKIHGDYLLPTNLEHNYTNYSLDEVLELLKKDHVDNLNYDSLKRCVKQRNKNIATRNKIIERVCLELLNLDNDQFGYGYYRAEVFLKDFNNFLNLNLGTDYLNRIIEKSSLEKKKQKVK